MTQDPGDVAVPLDELLVRAASGPFRRLLPGSSGVAFLKSIAGDPGMVADKVGRLAGELSAIATGKSRVAPPRGDRRFADPAWASNPVLRRIMQAYLATSAAALEVVDDAGLDWRDHERMSFLVSNLIEAAAPSNNPVVSPAGWKAIVDTGGANLVRGPLNLVRDMSAAPRIPTMVDPKAYEVGKDLALTPGSVVYRSEMFEIIQYTPQTEQVRSVPLLIVPPTINKFYALDLQPGRSLVEYLVREGQQSFVMSWRNPDARHRDWGFDAYVKGLIEAFDVVDKISGVQQAHVVATCSGGMLACLAAGHRAAEGRLDRLASLSLLVTMMDQRKAGVPAAILDEKSAKMAIASSAKRGYLDGRNLAESFAWLRPSDLIWNYWVNNYLRGQAPPKFDILFWNADTTRMTAALHRDFVDAALGNKLATAGAITVLGTPVDMGAITVDSYVVAGSADHICPWTNCYSSARGLGGNSRFVLSSNGHIAALVNPPGNPKSSYRVGDTTIEDPQEWLESAPLEKGSWWPDYAEWLRERSGEQVPAPQVLGSVEFPPLGAAPGTYVFEN